LSKLQKEIVMDAAVVELDEMKEKAAVRFAELKTLK
jgi:hypothetical protein